MDVNRVIPRLRRLTVAGVRRRISAEATRARQRIGAVAEGDRVAEDHGLAASFDAWKQRLELRVGSSVADRMREKIPVSATGARLAVVAHVCDQEELQSIVGLLHRLPVDFDFFVTSSAPEPLELELPEIDTLRSGTIIDLADQGRDILPLVSLVNAGLLEPYELVLKLRRGEQPDGLIGERDDALRALGAFASDPSLGILTGRGDVRGDESWRSNRPIASSILRRLQLETSIDHLAFAGSSNYWVRGFVLRGLRALCLSEWDFESEFGQVEASTALAMERVIGVLSLEAGLDVREQSDGLFDRDAWHRYDPSTTVAARARVLAFYDTRYATNDGMPVGETDSWSAVASARPAIREQFLPVVPAELGFYDEMNPGVRRMQRELAARSGIEGFAVGVNWSANSGIGHPVLDAMAADDDAGSFCVHWQLDWAGSDDRDALTDRDVAGFMADAAPLLAAPQAVRVNGRPVLLVSGLTRIEAIGEILAGWRNTAHLHALGHILIVAVSDESWSPDTGRRLRERGVDAVLERPQRRVFLGPMTHDDLTVNELFRGEIRDYSLIARAAESVLKDLVGEANYPGVLVGYDDTPTAGLVADVTIGANPFTFRRWLDEAVSAVSQRDFEDRIVFIDSWNSWQHASVMEPSQRFGTSYLAAVRDVLFR